MGSFQFMSDVFKEGGIKKCPHSLDDVLQDLQTKVSHNSWLRFVSQLQAAWHTQGVVLFELFTELWQDNNPYITRRYTGILTSFPTGSNS